MQQKLAGGHPAKLAVVFNYKKATNDPVSRVPGLILTVPPAAQQPRELVRRRKPTNKQTNNPSNPGATNKDTQARVLVTTGDLLQQATTYVNNLAARKQKQTLWVGPNGSTAHRKTPRKNGCNSLKNSLIIQAAHGEFSDRFAHPPSRTSRTQSLSLGAKMSSTGSSSGTFRRSKKFASAPDGFLDGFVVRDTFLPCGRSTCVVCVRAPFCGVPFCFVQDPGEVKQKKTSK